MTTINSPWYRDRAFWYALLGIALLETISLWAFLRPVVALPALIAIGIAALLVSWYALPIGISLLAAELVIGSQGHLLAVQLGPLTLSLRLVLFLAVMMAWLGQSLRQKKLPIMATPYWYPWLAVVTLFGFAVVNGWWREHDPQIVFLDANGYLFFGLLPAIVAAYQQPGAFRQTAHVVVAALLAMSAKTLLLLLFFSHQVQSWLPLLYRWVRTTGVGEITRLDDGSYRIFFQSHIFAVIGLLGVAFWYLAKKQTMTRLQRAGLLACSAFFSSIVIISGSRSFWLAGLVAITFGFLWLLAAQPARWKILLQRMFMLVIATLAGLGLLSGILALPYPQQETISSGQQLLKERTTINDAATSSRRALLWPLADATLVRPLTGQGFGTTVTYRSSDPRVLQNNASGSYTTYAFEWGWLDQLLKFGITGTLLFLWLLLTPLPILWRNWKFAVQPANLLAGIGALALGLLATVHALTPYLNHPLGIGLFGAIVALTLQLPASKKQHA